MKVYELESIGLYALGGLIIAGGARLIANTAYKKGLRDLTLVLANSKSPDFYKGYGKVIKHIRDLENN